MDNKLLVFIFGLFIIYFLCKNNVMKGGEKTKIISDDITDLQKYSIQELEKILNIKKIRKKLNNIPKIHSKISNYELYLELGGHSKAYDIIINGRYWAEKAFRLKNLQRDFHSIIKTPLSKREEKFYSIKNSYNIKNNLEKQNKMKNNEEMINEEMINEKMMKKNNTVVCPDKSEGEYCDGKMDCWKTNFCECPVAQELCKKNMAKKIMNDFNINDNEEVDRILNIFHGNSSVLHNLPKTKQQIGINESSKINTFEELEKDSKSKTLAELEKDAITKALAELEKDSKSKTLAELEKDAITKNLAELERDTKVATKDNTETRALEEMRQELDAKAEFNANATSAPATTFTGGMNELYDDMEILNKFHGGSINYEKF
jgi:hypothetical protein